MRTLGLRLVKIVERLFPGSRNELPRQHGPLGAHLEIQTGFTAWLAEYAAALQGLGLAPSLLTLDPRVEEIVQLLDRPGKSLLQAEELSKRSGLSPSQINRLFLRQLGTTLHSYRERQRLASARTLLTASDLSVKETAFRLGFLSPQHFSRWFRKHTGLPPTQLRQTPTPMM